MLLSVIIVSYNTADLTIQTLKSVLQERQTSTLLKNQTEIILIDNNSTDDSVGQIKKLLKSEPQTFVIQSPENLGFGRANNLGIEKATGEYLLLLNSDTIVKPGALETLVKTFQARPIDEVSAHLNPVASVQDRLGILACQLLNPDGSIQAQGGRLPSLGTLASHMLFLDDIPVFGKLFASTQETGLNQHSSQTGNQLIPKGWVSFAAVGIRREVIAEIDALDPQIFMYGEDVEFCLRARHHHWDIAIEPQAHITHFGSASSSSANAIKGEFKGYLHIWAKHFPHWQLPLAKTLLRLGALLRVVIFGTISKQPNKAAIYKQVLAMIK